MLLLDMYFIDIKFIHINSYYQFFFKYRIVGMV